MFSDRGALVHERAIVQVLMLSGPLLSYGLGGLGIENGVLSFFCQPPLSVSWAIDQLLPNQVFSCPSHFVVNLWLSRFVFVREFGVGQIECLFKFLEDGLRSSHSSERTERIKNRPHPFRKPPVL